MDTQPKSIFRTILPERMSKKQRNLAKKQVVERLGNYIFENNTTGDLYLPRETASGVRKVVKGGRFEGDHYYFQMVKTNELKYVEEVKMKEEKLLTEQPPTVTGKGTIEHVVETSQKINEEQDETPKPDILLNEEIDGVSIL